MKKFIAFGLLAITTVFLGSGCLSSTYHLVGEDEFPYNGTTDCFNNCICVWGHEPQNEIEEAIDSCNMLVYPFWVVDFPLEIAFDTILLPYDGCKLMFK